jgi:hypothetical protein
MKRMIFPGLVSGALFAALALASPAGAIDKPGTAKPAPVATKKMGSSNMTKEDCDGLGGTIVAAVGICETGQLCKMTGENKKDHAVCITKQ